MADDDEVARLRELQAEAAGIAARIAQREAAEAAKKAQEALAYAEELKQPKSSGKGSTGSRPVAPKEPKAAATTRQEGKGKGKEAALVPRGSVAAQTLQPPAAKAAQAAAARPAGAKAAQAAAAGAKAGSRIAALLSGPPVTTPLPSSAPVPTAAAKRLMPSQPKHPPPKRLKVEDIAPEPLDEELVEEFFETREPDQEEAKTEEPEHKKPKLDWDASSWGGHNNFMSWFVYVIMFISFLFWFQTHPKAISFESTRQRLEVGVMAQGFQCWMGTAIQWLGLDQQPEQQQQWQRQRQGQECHRPRQGAEATTCLGRHA